MGVGCFLFDLMIIQTFISIKHAELHLNFSCPSWKQ